MAAFANQPMLNVWYAHLDAQEQLTALADAANKKLAKAITRSIGKARKRTALRALEKLTEVVDGQRRFVPDPPLLVPAEEVEDLSQVEEFSTVGGLYAWMRGLVELYTESIAPERRLLIENYVLTQAARKVVGVGSVGLRAWVLLMEPQDGMEPLLLQAKEAGPSVLSRYLGASRIRPPGRAGSFGPAHHAGLERRAARLGAEPPPRQGLRLLRAAASRLEVLGGDRGLRRVRAVHLWPPLRLDARSSTRSRRRSDRDLRVSRRHAGLRGGDWRLRRLATADLTVADHAAFVASLDQQAADAAE